MSFIRPEVVQFFRRWAETLIMAGAGLLVLWFALSGFAFRSVLVSGGLFALAAVLFALTWIAAQKARLRRGGADPGVVSVEEARITYFGPEAGGEAHLEMIAEVAVCAGREAVWIVRQKGYPPLIVPAAARGAEALAEAFAALPGFRFDRAAAAFEAGLADETVIWRR